MIIPQLQIPVEPKDGRARPRDDAPEEHPEHDDVPHEDRDGVQRVDQGEDPGWQFNRKTFGWRFGLKTDCDSILILQNTSNCPFLNCFSVWGIYSKNPWQNISD